MKKLILSGVLLAAGCWQVAQAQVVIPRTDIHYNINYHWGFVDVNIARGVVSIESDGVQFNGTLDGTSIPWEGRIICVSDTLKASVSGENGVFRENVEYQNGWYRRPMVNYYRSNNYNPDDPAYFKSISGEGSYDASHDTMEAITVTADMIGMYYFAHAIDFESLSPGDKVTVDIAGPYSKQLVVTYQGKGIYRAGGDTYPTYNCSFEYGYEGGLSGYPVDCKISASDRIPVYLSASLPVGHVEMLYDPS